MNNIATLITDGQTITDGLESSNVIFDKDYVKWINSIFTPAEAYEFRGDEVDPSNHDLNLSPYDIFMLGKGFNNDAEEARVINLALQHELENINKEFSSTLIGGKPAVIREFKCPSFDHDTFDLLTKSGAKQWFENRVAYKALLSDKGKLSVKKINIIEEWWRWEHRKSFPNGLVMAPNKIPDGAYNLFRGFHIKPSPGSWDLMEQLILEGICDNDLVLYEWVLDWMAYGLQKPETLQGIALVMRGSKGIGKGQFAKYYGILFGQHFLPITQDRHLTGNFNSHQAQALLIFADELIWGGNKQSEGVLKALITEDSFMLERKGFDSYLIKNYMRLLVASNEAWAVPAGSGERRWCICDCSDKFKGNYSFFKSLEDQMLDGGLEAMMHDLKHRNLTTNQREAPRTKALTDIAIKGFTPIEKWLFEKLDKQDSNFGNQYVSSQTGFTTHPNLLTWGGNITAEELYTSYSSYCDAHNIRERDTRDMVCKNVKKLLNLPKARRPLVYGVKTTTYQLPTFSDARLAFSKAVDLEFDWY